jgi:hypothetical protein
MSAWLIALGLSPGVARWILRGVLAAIVAIAFGATFVAGYRFKAHEVTQQQLKIEQQRSAALVSLQKKNARLAVEISAEKTRDRVVYRTLTKKVPYVIPEIVEIPVAGPAVCTVSNDFVRVWNDALIARLSNPTGGTSDPTSGAGVAGSTPNSIQLFGGGSSDERGAVDRDRTANDSSGIRPGGLLDNHVENADTCHEIRRQLARLIAWHEANDP